MNRTIKITRPWICPAILLPLMFAGSYPAHAVNLFTCNPRGYCYIPATQRDDRVIARVDVSDPSVYNEPPWGDNSRVQAICTNLPIEPDSLLIILNATGDASYIYAGVANGHGEVRKCTPKQVTDTAIDPCDAKATGQSCDTLLASTPATDNLQDMILEPLSVSKAAGIVAMTAYSASTLLVSDNTNGILRIDLTNPDPQKAYTTLIPPDKCKMPQGLAYVGTKLFALCGFSTPADDGFYQFDSTKNGSPLVTKVTGLDPTGSLDGLIFDPSVTPNGMLFATSKYSSLTNCAQLKVDSGKCSSIYQLDPVALTGGPIGPNTLMPIQFDVLGPDGIITNQQGSLFVANRGNGYVYKYDLQASVLTKAVPVPGLDDLGIVPLFPPLLTKAFVPNDVSVGNTSTMNFKVSNPNFVDLLNVIVSDTLPSSSGVFYIDMPNQNVSPSSGCGTVTFSPPVPPYKAFAWSVGTLTASQACTLSLVVTGEAVTSGQPACTVTPVPANPSVLNTAYVSSSNAGQGSDAYACIAVTRPVAKGPTIKKTFDNDQPSNPAAPNQHVHMHFWFSNTDPLNIQNNITLHNVRFICPASLTPPGAPSSGHSCPPPNGTDQIPVGVSYNPSPIGTNTCKGTITSPGTDLGLNIDALAPGASCEVSFEVWAAADGEYTNSVGVTSDEAPGNTSQDTLYVSQVITFSAPQYLVSYAAHLDAGDSTVNLTNYGTLDGRDPNGRICANVYVFDPAEEPVSCCACLITPNGLSKLSVRNDLMSNAVTRGVPTSAVIKLVASPPINGTCDPANIQTLVRGLGAWRTTLHALPAAPVTYQGVESEFNSSDLSTSELSKLTTLCGFIETYASGYGICKSCRSGALGATTQK